MGSDQRDLDRYAEWRREQDEKRAVAMAGHFGRFLAQLEEDTGTPAVLEDLLNRHSSGLAFFYEGAGAQERLAALDAKELTSGVGELSLASGRHWPRVLADVAVEARAFGGRDERYTRDALRDDPASRK